MAGSRSLTLLLSCALASCTAGGRVDVEVVARDDVRFVVPEDARDRFCLNSLALSRRDGAESEPVWRIALRPDTAGAPCRFEVRFPQVPPGFAVDRPASALAPGSYLVEIDGGVPQVSTTFEVR